MSETKLMALREAVNLAMSEEMRKDENIFLMGEDVGIYGGDFGTCLLYTSVPWQRLQVVLQQL